MRKWVGCMLLICLVALSGCMNIGANKDQDVVVIVRGDEITVGYLRMLYPDDAMKEMIDSVVKAKLAEQEVKKMNIDVTKQVKEIEESYGTYPKDELNGDEAESIRTFADSQAKKLEMNAKEFYEKYTEISAKMAAYVNAYTSEVLGELEDDESGIEEYNHHANELLDDLVEQNKDEIKISIK